MKFIKNYKTSIPAILGLVAVILYWTGFINTEQLTTGMAVLTGLGLLGAKDADTK
jgi:hypothetical protein